ncbi:MAG TPA: ATP-binding cassette domain-containing protein, partial [Sphingomicrobium sp.]|nr:ATP-binding cassette domain-containing protein [Sphingomicrobium sp.]
MSEPLIDLNDVRLTLGEGDVRTEILKGVSLRLEPGESVAVLGPSGSGKSSLMAVVAGLERPDAGDVRLAGQDIGGFSEDALARLRGR